MRASRALSIGWLLAASAAVAGPPANTSPMVNSMTPSQIGGPGGSNGGHAFRASLTRPVRSPAGALLLQLVESAEERDGKQWRYLSFIVLGAEGKPEFIPRRRFAAWFPVVLGWDTLDRVWLRSGDIGVRMWAADATGIWQEHVWQANGPAIPSPDRVVWDAELRTDLLLIGGPLPDVLR